MALREMPQASAPVAENPLQTEWACAGFRTELEIEAIAPRSSRSTIGSARRSETMMSMMSVR